MVQTHFCIKNVVSLIFSLEGAYVLTATPLLLVHKANNGLLQRAPVIILPLL